jgi:TraM recognition site of TraD and TraG
MDTITAAPLNKLRALSTRSTLRLLLGQSDGLDVMDVLTKRRILLVKLSKGTVGAETAQLVGATLVATLWRAILSRTAIPEAHRRDVSVLIDEFQETVRLPLDIADMLAQARGLHASMTLANQTLSQLSDTVKAAALGTVRSSVAFQLDHDDAQTISRRFAPLTADDLMHLPAYEAALRLSVDGHTEPPVTGLTAPLPPETGNADALRQASQQRYGRPRSEVEAQLRARITPPGSREKGSSFGRRTTGGRP